MRVLMFGGAQTNTIGHRLMRMLTNMLNSQFTVVGRSEHNPLGGYEYVECDLIKLDDHPLADRIASGEFDLILVTAAKHGYGRLPELDYPTFCEAMDINLYGPLSILRNVLRGDNLKEIRIAFLSSDAAVKPMSGNLLYNVSKAALEMMVKQQRRELRAVPALKISAFRPPHIRDTRLASELYQRVAHTNGVSQADARASIVGAMTVEEEDFLLYRLALSLVGDYKQAIYDYTGGRQ